MNFSFLNNWPIFRLKSNAESETETKSVLVKSESPKFVFWNVKCWGRSFQYMISWAISLKNNIWPPPLMSSEMPRYPRSYGGGEPGCPLPQFRPYVAKVPWHRGPRGFLSQLFPRYGHYCGPNWSSGKDNGLPLWDKRPIDWLDFCCYCHDIGYDTHDQERLLKADLAFLECLERPRTIWLSEKMTRKAQGETNNKNQKRAKNLKRKKSEHDDSLKAKQTVDADENEASLAEAEAEAVAEVEAVAPGRGRGKGKGRGRS